MARALAYRVCYIQESRVTFVNGEWQGQAALDPASDASLQSCPKTWEFLREAGAAGWELVGVGSHTKPGSEGAAQVLYLCREYD